MFQPELQDRVMVKGTTIVVTSGVKGEAKGEGSSSSTYTITGSPDGSKKTVEKRVFVTSSDSGLGDEKRITINTDTDTKVGNTTTKSYVNIFPDDAYVIIDGVPGKLSDIKADEIQSVYVKKGDAVKALWGEKAAKGVLIISTKTGLKSTNKDKK
jgi:hypothetical protein